MSNVKSPYFDVIVIGAGAAGLMCAIEAGKRGRRVLVLEKADKAGRKILISGGGRCNFTNLYIESDAFISRNRHFCKSALARYTQWDFIALIDQSGLSWTEKKLGQLFCDQKSTAVLQMLLNECAKQSVQIELNCEGLIIEKETNYFIKSDTGSYQADSLVVASGGPSIPKMGSTDLGIRIAQQFDINHIPFKAALVPFAFSQEILDQYFKGLSGISVDSIVSCNGQSFRENVLITHRGISGPACLQISSYWRDGDEIEINLLPDCDAHAYLLERQAAHPGEALKTALAKTLPKRLASRLADTLIDEPLADTPIGRIKQATLKNLGESLNRWQLKPGGTQGMRLAEVSRGGVDTAALSSKTMEANEVAGLYFIGETVDVTGWLGGYNFQWAWSSGWVAGQFV